MSYFEEASKTMEISEEQKRAVEEMRKEGMGEEAKGLPIEYPKVELLHQTTAAFRFVASDEIVKTFKAAIVYVDAGRVWWPERFGVGGADGDKFPKCFSRDLVAPDKASEMPQGKTLDPTAPRPEGLMCGSCPQNQWGSAINEDGTEGRGKACKEVRRVFFIPENHLSPHWIAVPPSSLKALGAYFMRVRDAGFKKPQEVVTTFSAITKKNKGDVEYSELVLGLGPKLPEGFLAMVAVEKKAVEQIVTAAAPMSKEDYEGKKQGRQ